MRAHKSLQCLPVTYTTSTNMAAKERNDVLDVQMFNKDTERGFTFWAQNRFKNFNDYRQ